MPSFSLAISPVYFSSTNINSALATGLGDDFYSTIVQISEAHRSGSWKSLLSIENVGSVLYESNRYPTLAFLKEIVRDNEQSELYSANDIFKIVTKIFSITQSLEQYVGVDDILIDENFEVTPNPEQVSPLNTSEERFYVILGLMQNGCLSTAAKVVTFSGDEIDHKSISGEVLLAEPIECLSNGTSFPIKLNEKILQIPYIQRFEEHISSQFLWVNFFDASDVHLAISILAYKLLKENGNFVEFANISQFKIGSEFVKSLHRNGAGPDGKFANVVLDTCGKIIAGMPKKDLLPFRTDKKTTSAPRKRSKDKATALRTHITGGHEALRLMGWELPDGTFEFANIGPKNELKIEAGLVQESFQPDTD